VSAIDASEHAINPVYVLVQAYNRTEVVGVGEPEKVSLEDFQHGVVKLPARVVTLLSVQLEI
jgi:hypothetical protein